MKVAVTAPVVEVRLPRSGKVVGVHKKTGDLVKKGEWLVSLWNKQEEIELSMALAEYNRVRVEFDKLSRELPEARTPDEKTEKEVAQSKLDLAVKRVELAKLQEEMRVMISPVEGYVLDDGGTRENMWVTPGGYSYKIVDLGNKYGLAEVEKDQDLGSYQLLWKEPVMTKGKVRVTVKLPEGEYLMGEEIEI